MKHMSVESKDGVAQEADYEQWHVEKDPEKLWQAIIRMHKVDCVSNVTAVKELAARKAYQNIKQGSFESLAQFSERFRDTYRGYKATGTVTRPVDIPEAEQALDFFHGLDPARYGTFKTSMSNGWATQAFNPLATVSEIYRITGTWVKPASKPDGGTAATYVTIEEDARKKGMQDKKAKAERRKEQEKIAAAIATSGESGKSNEDDKKVPKDLSHIQCFHCKEFGHYSTSKDCPLHESKQDAHVNGT
jgi:hypothetical protein